MKTVYSNLTQISQSSTQEFFENFFQGTGSITEGQLSAVVAFFEGRTDNSETANSLIVALLSSAYNQGMNPMELLDQFRRMDAGQIDEYVAYLLNLSRYPTSAVGVSNVPTRGKYASRAILP
jgi:hypothetical protein